MGTTDEDIERADCIQHNAWITLYPRIKWRRGRRGQSLLLLLSLKMKRWETQSSPDMKLDLQEGEGIEMNERSMEARVGVESSFLIIYKLLFISLCFFRWTRLITRSRTTPWELNKVISKRSLYQVRNIPNGLASKTLTSTFRTETKINMSRECKKHD